MCVLPFGGAFKCHLQPYNILHAQPLFSQNFTIMINAFIAYDMPPYNILRCFLRTIMQIALSMCQLTVYPQLTTLQHIAPSTIVFSELHFHANSIFNVSLHIVPRKSKNAMSKTFVQLIASLSDSTVPCCIHFNQSIWGFISFI